MLDDLDNKIITELVSNGRKSYAEIATKYKSSISTISRRVERLLEDGIIKFSVVTDADKLGFLANAYIMMDIELGKIDEVTKRLKQYHNVHFVIETFGRFNVIIGIHCLSNKELNSFIKSELSTIEGVRQIDVYIEAKLIKRHWGWHPRSRASSIKE